MSAKSFFHAKDMTAKSSLDRGDNLTLTAATIQARRVVEVPFLEVNLTSGLRLLNKGVKFKGEAYEELIFWLLKYDFFCEV